MLGVILGSLPLGAQRIIAAFLGFIEKINYPFLSMACVPQAMEWVYFYFYAPLKELQKRR